MTDLTRLTLMTFPQHWDGTTLHLRVLVLPRGTPLDPQIGGIAFADANLKLAARFVPTPGKFPQAPEDVGAQQPSGIRLVMHDVANAFEFRMALAEVEGVADVGVGQVNPGDDAASAQNPGDNPQKFRTIVSLLRP